MKQTITSFMLAAALLLGFIPSTEGQEAKLPTNEPLKQLQGAWICIHEEVGGKTLSKDELKLKNRRLTITGTNFKMTRVNNGKFAMYDGRMEIKPAAPFGEFNLFLKGGGARIGIFQLTNDTFRLCYGDPNHKTQPDRPSKFETAPAAGREYFVFKRDTE